MGSWDAWKLLQAHPELFAGAIISAGCPDLSTSELERLSSNNILNFVGELDRQEIRDNVASIQEKWVRLDRRLITS
jgi:predicted peptidase